MSTRNTLVEKIATEIGSSKKDADDLLVVITKALKDQLTTEGQTVLPGFGRFKLVTRAARKGHNPKTGEPIDIAAKEVVKFNTFPSTTLD